MRILLIIYLISLLIIMIEDLKVIYDLIKEKSIGKDL